MTILHETKNLWCRLNSSGKFEVNARTNTHSFVVGEKATLEGAKTFMDRLERYPKNIRLLVPKENQFQVVIS